MKKLTQMQQKVYDYIAQFMTKWGYPPSVREICAELNFKSPSTAHFHILNLEKKGYLEHDAGKGRAIRLKGEAQAVPAVPAPLRRRRTPLTSWRSGTRARTASPSSATSPPAVPSLRRSAWRIT